MDELASIMNNVARLLAIVGGGISAIAVCYAGIMWMTASGDPQNMARARMGALGAVGGLVLVGIAFIVPRIISQTVIEPVGGVAVGGQAGQDCDQLFKNQLVFQRAASNTSRMQQVAAQIQATRDECAVETWNPVVVDATAGRAAICTDNSSPPDGDCTDPGDVNTPAANPSHPGCTAPEISGHTVPSGLKPSGFNSPRLDSGRDAENNIIIYFSDSNPPADSANCWLYDARVTTWIEDY